MEIKIIMHESELKILKNALKSYEGKPSEKKVIQDFLGLIEWQEQHQDKIKKDKDFSMCFLGDKSVLSEKLRNKCIEIENMAKNRPFVCNLALNYGGRDEIVHAVNAAIAEGCNPVTEADISRHLYTCNSPDPDLIIRTGGDLRVSNFLIWQGAYSELYVTDTLWPDFGRDDIVKAVEEFYRRKRRFGGLDPEDENK